jgi:hypothetical protein
VVSLVEFGQATARALHLCTQGLPTMSGGRGAEGMACRCATLPHMSEPQLRCDELVPNTCPCAYVCCSWSSVFRLQLRQCRCCPGFMLETWRGLLALCSSQTWLPHAGVRFVCRCGRGCRNVRKVMHACRSTQAVRTCKSAACFS